MIGTTIILLIYLAIFIGIPVLIGVYVYRDAKDRGMNAALWTLIAMCAPALIGFIVYLIVRGSYSDMKCPQCKTAVTEHYISCPNCGTKLKATCSNCFTPVEAGWNVCPKCASTLQEHYDDVSAPIRKKDKTLGKILLAVILIPVLLIVVMVLSLSTFSATSGGTGVTSLPIDEYLQEVNQPQIEEWLDNSGENYDHAYALRHESTSGEQVMVQYLVYMPRLVENPQISIGTSSGLFGRTLRLDVADSKGDGGNTLMLITCTGDSAPKLKLYYDGTRVDSEITDVEYSLNLAATTVKIQE